MYLFLNIDENINYDGTSVFGMAFPSAITTSNLLGMGL